MILVFCSFVLPLITSAFLAVPVKHSEKFIVRLTSLSLFLPACATLFLIGESLIKMNLPYEVNLSSISVSGHLFPIIAWVDLNTLGLLGLTHVLGLLVLKFSHGYLHLEKGYQRFFSCMLFFIFGMNLLSLAGNMDLFFAGWEIVGFSSFLLIAFYRANARSVQNAWKIYNVYRICDLGLLLGAVLGHVLWHEATKFSGISDPGFVFPVSMNTELTILSLFIVLASLGKSAQFPFHNWPSRAMEGPTPSSAIFYGALSIHAGVFLLLRTQPLWINYSLISLMIVVIGLITIFVSTIQGRIQTNIKGQIAFASTSQIGLMFVELGLGFTRLVLLHMVTHALYRCFQLLVSPSVVAGSSSLNNKFIVQRILNRKNWMDNLHPRIRNTLFVLGMTDFSLDISWRGFGFIPWKPFYRILRSVINPRLLPAAVMILSVISIIKLGEGNNENQSFPLMLAVGSLFFSLRSIFIHNNSFSVMKDMTLAFAGCMLCIYFLDERLHHSIMAYALPVGICMILGLLICWKFRKVDIRHFNGLGTHNSWSANMFLICFMVISGMPVSSAFIGEDMLLENIIPHSPLLTGLITICFMINGLVCVKLYTRLFMGRAPLG